MSNQFRAGDIVACFGTSALSRAISYGTASPFAPRGLRIGPSHVALVVPYHGRLVWAESTTLTDRPCLIADKPVKGWQLHHIDERLADYYREGGRVDVYRLHPFYEFDVPEALDFGRWSVDYWQHHRARYDARNALFSGSRLVRLLRLYKPADIEALFCSEYIAAVLRRMHRLSNSENPGRFSPATLLRELLYSGTYQRVPAPPFYHPPVSIPFPADAIHAPATAQDPEAQAA